MLTMIVITQWITIPYAAAMAKPTQIQAMLLVQAFQNTPKANANS